MITKEKIETWGPVVAGVIVGGFLWHFRSKELKRAEEMEKELIRRTELMAAKALLQENEIRLNDKLYELACESNKENELTLEDYKELLEIHKEKAKHNFEFLKKIKSIELEED